jgi:hypothetical protein
MSRTTSSQYGPDVRLYWDQAVYKKPRTEAPFPWHQDKGYTFVEPQQYLTRWVALTDADLKTGPNQSADHVRKAYIVQFAPEGAATVQERAGDLVRTPCAAPERQYPVLVGGAAPGA